MNFKLGLAPVVGECPRILILGSMPGDESIRRKQYYAHGNNQFWRILSEVYGEAVGENYPERLEFLSRKRLALWDVLRSAERVGSLDSDIKNEVANNIGDLLIRSRTIETIAFNGGKANTLFRRYIQRSQVSIIDGGDIILPSTSPTPGRHVPALEEKVIRWKLALTERRPNIWQGQC